MKHNPASVEGVHRAALPPASLRAGSVSSAHVSESAWARAAHAVLGARRCGGGLTLVADALSTALHSLAVEGAARAAGGSAEPPSVVIPLPRLDPFVYPATNGLALPSWPGGPGPFVA